MPDNQNSNQDDQTQGDDDQDQEKLETRDPQSDQIEERPKELPEHEDNPGLQEVEEEEE